MTETITHHLPKIVNKTREDLDGLMRRLTQTNLSEEDRELLIGCVEFSTWLPEVIREKNISIRNLQRMLFGESGGKKKKKKDSPPGSLASVTQATSNEAAANDSNPQENSADVLEIESTVDDPVLPEEEMAETKNSQKGHGRMPHSVYKTATDVFVPLNDYCAGDDCPERCGGRLYSVKRVGSAGCVIIRIAGNPLANIHRYYLETLRCPLCDWCKTAALPPNVPMQKYDSAFKAQLSIQKYYVGVPFYRQAQLQRVLGFPLAAATQFELVEHVADSGYPIIKLLEKKAANGELVHNDDTWTKILSVIKENKSNPDKKRTGMYTTGLLVKAEDHIIVLYYTGTKHSGENLETLLRNRDTDKPVIIQMSDGSSMNIPKPLKTILCNCLSHGIRKFRDLLDFFPEPCFKVMKALAAVFTFDEHTKKMTPIDRWQYHRQHSKPIMLELHGWLKAQLIEKQVEPNSSLGKAMRYLLKHWKGLRRFLVVPGAPIDNNIIERALKIPIRVRKNSMFYKTEHGATIGNILTSLIYTAVLSQENPFDYLVALQDYKSLVFQDPEAWLPWNFRHTLEKMATRKAA